MHVLRMTYDQKHALRTMDKRLEDAQKRFDEAQTALNAVAKELDEIRQFRADAMKGMCEDKFGKQGDYVVEQSEDGEYLTYRYQAQTPLSPLGYRDPLGAIAAQQQQHMTDCSMRNLLGLTGFPYGGW